jgi:hypothetical protein
MSVRGAKTDVAGTAAFGGAKQPFIRKHCALELSIESCPVSSYSQKKIAASECNLA